MFSFNLLPALTEVLLKEYKDRASRLHPLPWLKTTRFELDKAVYTRLGIVQRENTLSKLTKKTVMMSDIFEEHEYRKGPIRTVLIEGSPGMGKTTLSLKLAYDWAMGRMPSKFPPVHLVFLLRCRDMKGDILETIIEQLLPLDRNSLKINLCNFIEEQTNKFILFVDGLDEIPEAATEHVMNLLTAKCLGECYVVATCRQEEGLKVRQHFDTLLEIEGYSENDIREYVTRYFQDHDDPSLAEQLIENLKTDVKLQTLATNTLNTVLLCVVFEDYDGMLPSTVTELYDNIVYCITKRYCKKYDLEVEEKVLETSKETLGKLAYKGLVEDALSFNESNLNDKDIHCTKMGFLYKEDSKKKIKPDHTYWFLHKTFQEYLSAFYLTEKVKRQELTVDNMIEQLKDTKKFLQVLMFVSGMLHKQDAMTHKAFVEKLGRILSQCNRNKALDILCAVFSESDTAVDKDMAGIIRPFLPNKLQIDRYGILPRILNLLCTKDGLNTEVYIEEFNFNTSKNVSLDLRSICKALTEKLKVKRLNLAACHIGDEIADNLADMLSHNSNVEELFLQRNNFTEEGAKILAGGLGQNSYLKKLDFSDNVLGNVGAKAIITTLTPDTSSITGGRRLSALHTLSFGTAIQCGGITAFDVAEMLRTNNTLKELDLDINGGIGLICEALHFNRTLNCLHLEFTDTFDSCNLVCRMLQSHALRYLCIGNRFMGQCTSICNNEAVALGRALKFNFTLEELHLYSYGITDEGLKCLEEALVGNVKLRRLCFGRLTGMNPGLVRNRYSAKITFNCDCKLRTMRGEKFSYQHKLFH